MYDDFALWVQLSEESLDGNITSPQHASRLARYPLPFVPGCLNGCSESSPCPLLMGNGSYRKIGCVISTVHALAAISHMIAGPDQLNACTVYLSTIYVLETQRTWCLGPCGTVIVDTLTGRP